MSQSPAGDRTLIRDVLRRTSSHLDMSPTETHSAETRLTFSTTRPLPPAPIQSRGSEPGPEGAGSVSRTCLDRRTREGRVCGSGDQLSGAPASGDSWFYFRSPLRKKRTWDGLLDRVTGGGPALLGAGCRGTLHSLELRSQWSSGPRPQVRYQQADRVIPEPKS